MGEGGKWVQEVTAMYVCTAHLANLELHGTSGESDHPETTVLVFENIDIQAFMVNGKISNGD